MDKFVQLPFVIPRLQPNQRKAYLEGLFSTPQDEKDRERVIAETNLLESEVRGERAPVDELARRVGKLAPRLASIEPKKACELGEQVISAGAHAFSDSSSEVITALSGQIGYLSDNPPHDQTSRQPLSVPSLRGLCPPGINAPARSGHARANRPLDRRDHQVARGNSSVPRRLPASVLTSRPRVGSGSAPAAGEAPVHERGHCTFAERLGLRDA